MKPIVALTLTLCAIAAIKAESPSLQLLATIGAGLSAAALALEDK